jgi:hypothetical protein
VRCDPPSPHPRVSVCGVWRASFQLPLTSRWEGRTTTWRAPGHRRAEPLPSRLFEIADTPVCVLVNAARAHLRTRLTAAGTHTEVKRTASKVWRISAAISVVLRSPRDLLRLLSCQARAETVARARPTPMQAVSDNSKALLHSPCTETDKQHGTRWRVDGSGSPSRKGP